MTLVYAQFDVWAAMLGRCNVLDYLAAKGAETTDEVRRPLPTTAQTLTWIETGEPTVRSPERLGFGSRLIKFCIENDLKGEMEQQFAPEGLRVRLGIPLR